MSQERNIDIKYLSYVLMSIAIASRASPDDLTFSPTFIEHRNIIKMVIGSYLIAVILYGKKLQYQCFRNLETIQNLY